MSITYNPTYTTAPGRTLTHDLRPDVVVDSQHPRGEHKIHAFDAKYRREAAPSGTWLPLAEDIDRMHAYRDAIGQLTPNAFTRILQSAIVLYPAPLDTRYHTHPFYKSLSHGVGALPLLPGDSQTQKAFQAYIQNNVLKNPPPNQSSL